MGEPRHLPQWKVMVLVIGSVMAVLLAVGTLFYAVRTNRNQTLDNADLAHTIQDERARSSRLSCENQNTRNRAAMKALAAALARLPAAERPPATSIAARTIIVINAIAPVRDCDAVVKSQVPTAKAPP